MTGRACRWLARLADWWARRCYPSAVSQHWLAEQTREDR